MGTKTNYTQVEFIKDWLPNYKSKLNECHDLDWHDKHFHEALAAFATAQKEACISKLNQHYYLPDMFKDTILSASMPKPTKD